MHFPDLYIGDDARDHLDGRTSPGDRPVLAVRADRPTVLTWAQNPAEANASSPTPAPAPALALVLTVAIDTKGLAGAGGPNRELLVYAGKGEGQLVARMPVRYEDPYQVLTIPLDLPALRPAAPTDMAPAIPAPLVLRLQVRPGDGFLWIFAPDRNTDPTAGLRYHLPHLVVQNAPHTEDSAAAAVLDRLCSLASLQSFSWKEGCVLDALLALHDTGRHPRALPAIMAHLREFGFKTGCSASPLLYESPRGIRITNQLDTIESTLPFAILARLAPGHPWLHIATSFWEERLQKNGQVHDGDMYSSEGAYTVAYPMAAIGALRGDDRWIALAQQLLLDTGRHLIQLPDCPPEGGNATVPPGIYLRSYTDGRFTHRNWARGLAWLLLGHVQTLRQVPTEQLSPQAVAQLKRIAEFARRHQRADGLWSCYVDQPQLLADCAGSAGIAAGFALGIRHGFLPVQEYRPCAESARAALLQHISQEGFLQGCSQSNKAGEELQLSDYRVTTPYASGLLALLDVALQ